MSFYPIIPWSCAGQKFWHLWCPLYQRACIHILYSIALGGRNTPSLCKQQSFLCLGYLFSLHWGSGGTAAKLQLKASSPPFLSGHAGNLATGFVTLNIYQASGRLQKCAVLCATEAWITFRIVTSKKCRINSVILYCAVHGPQITGGGITWKTINLWDSHYRCGEKTTSLWEFEMQSSWHSFILKW